jgi:hypothetical protein
MRKFIGLLAVTGLALLSLAGMASASSNLANGTVLTGTGTGVSLGGFITCHSTVKGTLFNKPAGQGVHASLTAASFGPGCSPAGTSASPTGLPWTLETTGSTNGGQTWDGAVTGVSVDLFVFGVQCHYQGNVGALYENSTMQLTLSGSLPVTAGSNFLCPGSGAVVGTYHISPTLTLS